MIERMVASLADVKNAEYSVRLRIISEPRSSDATPLFPESSTNNDPDALSQGALGLGTTVPFTNPAFLLDALPAEVALDATITSYAETDKPVDEARARFVLDATYQGGDATFAAGLELRKIGTDVYGMITKFPSLFFMDFTALKQQWVALTAEDGSGLVQKDTLERWGDEQGTQRITETLRTVFDLRLFAVEKKLSDDIVGSDRTLHYRITADPAQLLPVYQALRDRAAQEGKPTESFERALEALKDSSLQDQLRRFAEHSVFEVWVNRTNGMLRQVAWTLLLVPSESVERLRGTQFRSIFTLTLDHVNEAVEVSPPSPAITYDEAVRLLTGITKEEQDFEKQINRITALQSALRAYHTIHGTYPDSLTNLVQAFPGVLVTCKEERYARDASCLAVRSVGVKPLVVTDVYTRQPYGYANTDEEIAVTYELRFFEGMSNILVQEYADGTNTMTSSVLSQEKAGVIETSSTTEQSALESVADTITATDDASTEKEEPLDTDADGLDDREEALYGTNKTQEDSDGDTLSDFDEITRYDTDPTKADSDGDGFDDATEITNGYNPTGEGKATALQQQDWELEDAP